ncbi:hypothetical protein Y717_13245 [Streptomyces scopuliridis RB72]|uniref:Uncharacterized protein n=1 Tax=Streptomyces scopuliridis RB72 TaxID=1440053 RepID=A0A2T7SN36_9ACTN|nr:hypothetical protein Y717_13245 [Streptomyces scopuliridis RB72]
MGVGAVVVSAAGFAGGFDDGDGDGSGAGVVAAVRGTLPGLASAARPPGSGCTVQPTPAASTAAVASPLRRADVLSIFGVPRFLP